MTDRDGALLWRPLPEANTQPGITPVQWIVHTAVDGPGDTALDRYFARADITLESHTWLSWRAHAQLVPFNRSADANYKANRYLKGGRWVGAVSTETEDDGSPVTRPWNQYQLDELVRFGVWLNRTYGIPARLPRSWDDPGMGYHSLFPMIWTPVRGKTCPGATRILQFVNYVLPRINDILNGDDMSAEAERQIKVLYDTFAGEQPNTDGSPTKRIYKVLDNAMWTKERIDAVTEVANEAKAEAVKAREEAHAAAVLGSGNNQMLAAICDHLGIDRGGPPDPAA